MSILWKTSLHAWHLYITYSLLLKYDKLKEQNCSWEINVAYPYIHKFTSLVHTNVRQTTGNEFLIL